jgi:2-keto-4-pentenoate hydratase/acetyl esterase/lipase
MNSLLCLHPDMRDSVFSWRPKFGRMVGAALWLTQFVAPLVLGGEPDRVFNVWPGKPPGDLVITGPERKVEGRPRPFYQITGIATPTVSVFLPSSGKRNGTGVLVCPGGGLQRVAYEHEGMEVAEWLNAQGISAFVLKYRAPAPALEASQDAQRALSYVREHASEWQVDPNSIGVLGFSAGGEIVTWLGLHAEERLYAPIDATDTVSCRPDFVGAIYSGGLLAPGGGGLKEPLSVHVRAGLPSFFIAHAFDDASENSLQLALALKRGRVPTELHLYREGGHGAGPRRTGVPFSGWKDRFGEWLGSLGYADGVEVRKASSDIVDAFKQGNPPPRFVGVMPGGSLDDAYRVQRRVVRSQSARDGIAGFKGAAASAAAQTALGLEGPLAGVVFRSGRLDGLVPQTVEVKAGQDIVVETEVGYITSVDLSYEVLNDEQARGAVESIVPIIELPRSYPANPPFKAVDLVAMNIGSERYIVGKPVKAEGRSPDAIPVTLRRDGQVLHETTGGMVKGGQWANLRQVLNELTRHGYTIPAGSVILGGALGKIHPGLAGRYEADYGEYGKIAFEIRRENR